jgi:hypothetical protein
MSEFFIKIQCNKICTVFFNFFFLLFFLIGAACAENLQSCPKTSTNLWTGCFGMSNFQNGDVYVGTWRDGLMHGSGGYIYFNGNRYFGEFKNHQRSGAGIFVNKNSEIYVGEYRNDKRDGVGILKPSDGNFIWASFDDKKKNGLGAFYSPTKNVLSKGRWAEQSLVEEEHGNFDCSRLEKVFVDIDTHLRAHLAQDRKYAAVISDIGEKFSLVNELTKKLDFHKLNFCGEKENTIKKETRLVDDNFLVKNKFSLNVVAKKINENGEFDINISSSNSIKNLYVNGEEVVVQKGAPSTVKKYVRAGQEAGFTIFATDAEGNSDTKTITVSRPIANSTPPIAALNPALVKKQPERDAVVIIIGIADYKNLPRADFANDDARVFYDYAIRALGVKPENIRLLVDADADQTEIYRAFKTWLPSRVRSTTDVYVYYSGHGLPTADGQGLYVLPQRADRDFIDKTAITQAEINVAIQAAKPRSVTMFLDACYSGQARTGETLLASARPVALKAERQLFPDGFTVISASQADQISSSSPDLKHGIFSYYLMRGMEGDADLNKDGKITAGEMHTYLTEEVARQAGMMNRQQVPQFVGDASRVLVGR